MLRCLTYITIVQAATGDFPDRNKTLFFDFVNEFTSSDTWDSLTNKATLIFPKNIYVRDENNRLLSLGGTNKNIGGFSPNTPIFLRGDKVTIEAGYKYFDGAGAEKSDTSIMFEGYISKVTSKKPIELECEDNMWKLKQIQAPNKVFPGKTYTLESMLRELLQGTGYTVNSITDTSIGDFRTQNETVAEVLARLRKDFHFESYFRGNELRTGSLVYIESEAITNIFAFQQNIISDELDYQRKDDVALSAVAYSINKFELSGQTKSGHKRTKTERLSVLVYFQNGKFQQFVKTPGEKADFPPNTGGERRTLYFWDVKSSAELVVLAQAELQKYYYTGFKGKFTTFGIPFVRQGDNVIIRDPILPERNGIYKVKAVEYKGGISGLRQTITLDYKIGSDNGR
jgi:hypothetical protein